MTVVVMILTGVSVIYILTVRTVLNDLFVVMFSVIAILFELMIYIFVQEKYHNRFYLKKDDDYETDFDTFLEERLGNDHA